jgi:thiazole/oxazole-forming peptide maturase SagD family component
MSKLTHSRSSGVSPAISFSSSLSHPSLVVFCKHLKALTSHNLARSLNVDTLFGFDLQRDFDTCSRTREWFLLFDLHRVFLYDDPMTRDAPHIDSVIRFVIDDYPYQPFALFADHFSRKPFVFLYDLACLDILPTLLLRNCAGSVVIVDFKDAEIRTATAQLHPEAASASHSSRPVRQLPLRLKKCPVGSGLRAGAIPPVADLVSPDVGLVRHERPIVTDTSLAGSLSRVAWTQGTDEGICGGHSVRPASARHIGRCEAIERFQVIFQRPDDISVYAPYSAIRDSAIDPESMFFCKALPNRTHKHQAYNPSLPLYWTWADRILEGKQYLVPAQEIWFNTRRLPGENICIRPTTNGCALGTSFEEAALFAILEAIERDAYLTTWYLRRPCQEITPDSVESDAFQLLWVWAACASQNYRIHLFDIRTDIKIPVVAAVGVRQRGDGPKTVHAAAASPFSETALSSALRDLLVGLSFTPESRPWDRARALTLLADPNLVSTSYDHRLLYGLDETFEKTSFLGFHTVSRLTSREIDACSLIQPSASYDLREMLLTIAAHLEQLGLPVLLKDITHPALAKRQLFCAKALIPGLYPMWYGHSFMRFAITDRLRALARKFTGRTLQDRNDVNLHIHPFG